MNNTLKAIIIDPSDNVATAIKKIEVGEIVKIKIRKSDNTIKIMQPIPFGHKFALEKIEKDSPVIKYGESIGLATKTIEKGEHVHIHNLESMRGKGKFYGHKKPSQY